MIRVRGEDGGEGRPGVRVLKGWGDAEMIRGRGMDGALSVVYDWPHCSNWGLLTSLSV